MPSWWWNGEGEMGKVGGGGVGVQIEKTDRNSSREERQRDKQAEGRRKGYN